MTASLISPIALVFTRPIVEVCHLSHEVGAPHLARLLPDESMTFWPAQRHGFMLCR